MKLYPKNLRNVKDLEKEKARLLKKKQKLDQEEVIPGLGIITGSGKDGKSDKGDGLGDILQFSNPVVSLLKDIIISRISKKADANQSVEQPDEPQEKGRSITKRLAIEFIGGYLKWKAIELSYKGIRYYIKKRKAE